MSKQNERARVDEDNMNSPNTDVTGSERRQRRADANEDRNIADTESIRGDDQPGRSMNQTGGHQEGTYDKQSSKPMTDKEGTGATDQ